LVLHIRQRSVGSHSGGVVDPLSAGSIVLDALRLTASEQRVCGTSDRANVVMPEFRLRRGALSRVLVLPFRPDQRGSGTMLGTCFAASARNMLGNKISPQLVIGRRWVPPSSHICSGSISAPLPLLAQTPPTLTVHADTPPSSPTSTLFFSILSGAGCSPWDSHFELYLPLLTRGRCRSQSRETLACQRTASIADCRGAWLVGRRW
jgi:hypothetical protein